MQFNGHAIRAIRLQRRLTISALAKASNLGQPHLSLIESGKRQPSLEAALRIAWHLGVDDLRAIQTSPGSDWYPVPEPVRAAS